MNISLLKLLSLENSIQRHLMLFFLCVRKFVLEFGHPPATTPFLSKPLWENSQKNCLDLLSSFLLFPLPPSSLRAGLGYTTSPKPASSKITSGLQVALPSHGLSILCLTSPSTLSWPHLAVCAPSGTGARPSHMQSFFCLAEDPPSPLVLLHPRLLPVLLGKSCSPSKSLNVGASTELGPCLYSLPCFHAVAHLKCYLYANDSHIVILNPDLSGC